MILVALRVRGDHGLEFHFSLLFRLIARLLALSTCTAVVMRRVQDFTVHVYRPNGWLLTKISESATSAQVAVNRAKVRIYQQGRLAHFYTYVAISH